MASYAEKLRNFALDLYKVDAIKFGEYKTKVGLLTPVYCDLRLIVSYPKMLVQLGDLIVEKIQNLSLDIICGVPYTALPIATAVSLKLNTPMVMRRKEAKDYGTKKLVEGNFKEGDRCLIVEDVITSGSSILETVNDLKNCGIKATDAVILLNREQGGEAILKDNGIITHALLTMTQLTKILREENLISEETLKKIRDYISENQIGSELFETKCNRLNMTYFERMKFAKNQVTYNLFKIMHEKETNLCVAADLTRSMDVLNLAESVGFYVCLFKIHVDIIEDFHDDFIKRLLEIAKSCNFILCEDRKFGDIGKTVDLQYSRGIYKISSWANLITAHSVMGKGILDVFKKSEGLDHRGVFLLAQASTGGIINEGYSKSTIEMGKCNPDIVTGFVCQSPLFLEPEFIQLTPGVQFESKQDTFDQNYHSPEKVILEKGADIAVVGRGITKSANPAESAQKYQKSLWGAYLQRVCK